MHIALETAHTEMQSDWNAKSHWNAKWKVLFQHIKAL